MLEAETGVAVVADGVAAVLGLVCCHLDLFSGGIVHEGQTVVKRICAVEKCLAWSSAESELASVVQDCAVVDQCVAGLGLRVDDCATVTWLAETESGIRRTIWVVIRGAGYSTGMTDKLWNG